MPRKPMTPTQKIKLEILKTAAEHNEFIAARIKDGLTGGQVDYYYSFLEDEYDIGDVLHDIESEFRQGQVETGLPAPYSRHYECDEVASQMSDGSWVGWTRWYG